MLAGMKRFLQKLPKRLRALLDPSSWLLIAIGVALLAILDFTLLATLVQWTLFAFAMAGLTIFVSRITFPQVDLSALMDRVDREGDIGEAIVAAAIIIYCAAIFIGLVMWAK